MPSERPFEGLRAGPRMIGNMNIYVWTRPIDFRKGMDGLVGLILSEFRQDPLAGSIFIFRSRRAIA